MRPSRRLTAVLTLLLPVLLRAEEPGVPVSTLSDSGLVEEEIPVIGFTIQRRDSTTGQYKVPVRKPSQHAPDSKTPGSTDPASTAGQWEADANPQAPRKPRRVLIDIGGGEEPIRDLTEPPFPTGEDTPYDWDSRLLLRQDGVAWRMKLRDRLGFREFTLIGRFRFDIFHRTGLERVRDDVYDWVDLTAPPDKRGYLVGFQARKSNFWGYSLDYDRLAMSPVEGPSLDQVTSLGVGYTPLGINKGKVWNYTLNSSVHFQDISQTVNGSHQHRVGFGFAFGPVYQYGLAWVPIPGFSESYRRKHKIKLDRVRVHASYSDSMIHPSALGFGTDIVAYATRFVRLTVGADEVYLPRKGTWRFDNKLKLAVVIHFAAIKY